MFCVQFTMSHRSINARMNREEELRIDKKRKSQRLGKEVLPYGMFDGGYNSPKSGVGYSSSEQDIRLILTPEERAYV